MCDEPVREFEQFFNPSRLPRARGTLAADRAFERPPRDVELSREIINVVAPQHERGANTSTPLIPPYVRCLDHALLPNRAEFRAEGPGFPVCDL